MPSSVSSLLLSVVVVYCDNNHLVITDDISCRYCYRCGWIMKDELGMVGVSESWIESNQLCYIDGSMTDNV